MRLPEPVQRRLDAWVRRRLPPGNRVTLNQSRIFIIPTRQGLLMIALALVVLLLAINFESALNYALGFWLIAMVWAAVHLTYRNLSGLVVQSESGSLVEAGSNATYTLMLTSPSNRYRGPLELRHEHWGQVSVDMDGRDTEVTLSRPTTQRGRQTLPRFRLESRYPFGLVVAWSNLKMDLDAWAYPSPIERSLQQTSDGQEADAGNDHFVQAGTEDFHSLKEYQSGDSLHRLHWPSFARDELMVKHFVDYQAADEWLDWNALPGMPIELRCSALAWHMVRCQQEDRPFGLRLPGLEIPPDKGVRQLERCRQALAEFGEQA
jgi:uncharacterized protein (DUF58 family)